MPFEESSRRQAPSTRAPGVAQERDLISVAMQTRHTGWVIRDLCTGTLHWSESGKRLMGFQSDEEAQSADSWLRHVHPDDRASLEAHARKHGTEHRDDSDMEYRVVLSSGEIRWVYGAEKVVYDDHGAPIRSIGFITDVTDRKRADQELRECEAWLADQNKALEAALSGATLETSLAVLVQTVIDRLGQEARAAFYIANPEGTALHHVVGMSTAYAKAVDGFQIGPESLGCGLATHTGLPVVTSDVTQEPRWASWRWLAERFDYRACWSFPVKTSAGKFVGTLAIYSKQPREATPQDIEFAQMVGQTAAIIIARHSDAEVRRRAEQALRESEDRFRLFVANVQEYALIQTDPEGVVATWNPGAERLFAYVPEDMLGRSFSDLLTREDVESGVFRNNLATLTTGKRSEDARWFVRRDGTRFWARCLSEPILDEAGSFRGIANIVRDETARQQAADALREKELRISAIFEQAAVGLSELSLHGQFLRVNQELCHILGRTRDELLCMGAADVTHSDDIEHSLACIREAIDAVRPVSIDKRYRRADGTLVWANSVVTPLTDEQGQPRTLLVVTVDLTERQRAAEALRSSLAEKEELLREVHHRVKNNLQVIVSLITLQTLQIADEHILALFKEMQNRVLAISSIHELLYCAESFANIELLDYARQLVPGLVRFYGLEPRVEVSITGSGASLELERAVSYGMLLNELVSNACKHAFPLLKTGVITVGVQGDGTTIELIISDTGQGLPKGFDYQHTSSIGLTLVDALVRQLRGTIEVRSPPGTTVTVRFPEKADEIEK